MAAGQPNPRQCENKRVYFSEFDADCVASKRMTKDASQPPLRSYKCGACEFWHLTSKPLFPPSNARLK